MAQGSAINDIMQMRQQGLSNNQIIQNLQRNGYSNTQIFDAMNQADTKMAVEGVQPGMLQQNQGNSELFTAPPQTMSASQPVQPEFDQSGFQGQEPQAFYQDTIDNSEEEQVKIEELIEAIIEEKWTDLIKDVNKIVDWKNKMENRISEIEIKINSLKDNFSDLNTGVLGKINEYDRHIMEVGSEIKAMEKVFSKVLPAFTENVNELSRVAKKFKSGGPEL